MIIVTFYFLYVLFLLYFSLFHFISFHLNFCRFVLWKADILQARHGEKKKKKPIIKGLRRSIPRDF